MRRNAPPVQQGEKYCFRCATVKPVTDFYTDAHTPDGRNSRCKPCAKDASRESRAIRADLERLCRVFEKRSGDPRIDLGALELDLEVR